MSPQQQAARLRIGPALSLDVVRTPVCFASHVAVQQRARSEDTMAHSSAPCGPTAPDRPAHLDHVDPATRPGVDNPVTRREAQHARRSAETARLLAEIRRTSDVARRGELLDEVITVNRTVAASIARRYGGRGMDEEDLFQTACVGLVKAASRFDPALGHDFLTFAVPTVRGEVQRSFRDQGWAIRPPRRIQDLQTKLHRVVPELSQRLGREPTPEEVASALGIDAAAYREVTQAWGAFTPISLDRTYGGSSTSLGDALVDVGHSAVDAVEARLVIEKLMHGLGPVDRQLIHLSFWDDLTQVEIGSRLGLAQTQVSRRLHRLLGRLRLALDDRDESPR